MQNHTKCQVKDNFKYAFVMYLMFVTAICVLFLVRAFPEFHSERKKRTTSEGYPQLPKRFSRKLPFHLTPNRNFRIFWLNGKLASCPSRAIFFYYPECPEKIQHPGVSVNKMQDKMAAPNKVTDTRTELAELIKKRAEIAVSSLDIGKHFRNHKL